MTLSSLLNDGPVLTISYDTLSTNSNSFAWSDMPVIGDFQPNMPMEMNGDMMDKEEMFLSSLSLDSDLPEYSVDEPSKARKRGHNKSVSFNRYLEIREHALTIGDHPLCRDSLPLSLAWEHGETELLDLNYYEEQRLPHRRTGNEMKLSYYERKNLLRRIAGMTEADMRAHLEMHHSLPSSRNLSCFAGLSSSI
ncbi:hypothetical protein MHU86_7695 [Fragilaria crotonensis]|jgi:hypothetical protein|nr:hypothetical protein MHU86_7695 [Fragilaria crotonensis]